MRLLILFQRFLEARVVRSESDGSFTLTLSVPELERAFGKKFKSKTKYRTKGEQLLALLGLFLLPTLLVPVQTTRSSAATLTLLLAFFSRLLCCLCRLHRFFRARSSSLRHYLAPGSFPHRWKASFIFPTCYFLSPCCRSSTKCFFQLLCFDEGYDFGPSLLWLQLMMLILLLMMMMMMMTFSTFFSPSLPSSFPSALSLAMPPPPIYSKKEKA